jgi:hypothetical protein
VGAQALDYDRDVILRFEFASETETRLVARFLFVMLTLAAGMLITELVLRRIEVTAAALLCGHNTRSVPFSKRMLIKTPQCACVICRLWKTYCVSSRLVLCHFLLVLAVSCGWQNTVAWLDNRIVQRFNITFSTLCLAALLACLLLFIFRLYDTNMAKKRW